MVKNGIKGDDTESQLKEKCNQATSNPFLSEFGQAVALLFVLSRTDKRCRKWQKDSWELPSHLLPEPNLMFMQPKPSAYTSISFLGQGRSLIEQNLCFQK